VYGVWAPSAEENLSYIERGYNMVQIDRDNIVFGSSEAEEAFNRRFGGGSSGGGGGSGCLMAIVILVVLIVIGGIVWWIAK
jgi:hypothetical protein